MTCSLGDQLSDVPYGQAGVAGAARVVGGQPGPAPWRGVDAVAIKVGIATTGQTPLAHQSGISLRLPPPMQPVPAVHPHRSTTRRCPNRKLHLAGGDLTSTSRPLRYGVSTRDRAFFFGSVALSTLSIRHPSPPTPTTLRSATPTPSLQPPPPAASYRLQDWETSINPTTGWQPIDEPMERGALPTHAQKHPYH